MLCVIADCIPLYFPVARLHHSYEGIRWSKKKLKPACEARHHGHTFSLFATQGSVLFSGCATSLLASLSAFSYDSITANSLSSGEARGANGSGSGFQCNRTPGYLIRTFSGCCHCHLPPRKWVITCIFIIIHAKVSLVKRTDIRRAWDRCEGMLGGLEQLLLFKLPLNGGIPTVPSSTPVCPAF